MTLKRKLQDIKQDNKSVEEFAELVHAHEMVTERYSDAPERFIDTIDSFLKGIENKRAVLTVMDKDPTTLEGALQLVKGTINNQRLIIGARKQEVRRVRFDDAYSDSNEEPEFNSRSRCPKVDWTSLQQMLIL